MRPHVLLPRILSVAPAVALLACMPPDGETDPGAANAERTTLFLGAIRRAGFPCGEILDSTNLAGLGISWRVVCSDAQIYLASLENDDHVAVKPIPYTDTPRFFDRSNPGIGR